MTPSKAAARAPKKSPARSKKGEKHAPEATPPKLPPVQHALVPTHEILSPEAGSKVLAQLQTPQERLPKILFDDPGLRTDPNYVVLAESAEGPRSILGRLVRIRRPSPTAGEAVVYRVIVGGAAAREE